MDQRNPFPAIPTSDATRQTYLARGRQLAHKLSELAGSTDASAIAAQFLITSTGYAQRTFRLYKASLLHYLRANNAPPSVLKALADATSRDCPTTSTATSGRKAKTVNLDDRQLLLQALRRGRSASASLAADYFEAGLLIGPRPVEWIQARLINLPRPAPPDAPDQATHQLSIVNAKRDEAGIRGNGETRTFYATLSAAEAAVVARVIVNAQENAHRWPQHYSRMRAALRYAARKLWPTRKRLPSFYTTRHQSQADMKASGAPLTEIAATYGHASDNTATQHYARASQGDKNMCKLTPTRLSLAAVRNTRASERLVDRSARPVRRTTEPK